MAMKTGKEYIESLKTVRPRICCFGEEVKNVSEYPLFYPHIHAAAMTYELAHHPEFQELMVAESHLTGKKINRFTHIHQSTDDLVKKVRMMRMLGQRTATCFQRCVGFDGLNAVYTTSFNIDQKYKTNYHERFKKHLAYIQENDLMSAGAMSDPKGDRSLRPHEQEDPDMYLRIVEKRDDGIIVRGAKAHITGAVNSHEVVVMPTRAMTPEDKNYAVAFALPIDAPGISLVFGRQTNDTRRLDGVIDAGNPKYGIVGGEALIIFDDVFVPWERVFMCGEYEFAGELVETFAGNHRCNYGGCKVGLADVIIGASAWIAESNGLEKAANIRNLLAEMVNMAETCWGCSLACSYEGRKTPSGAFMINTLLAQTVKLNITRYTYEWMRLAQDIAGGIIITLPSEKDYCNPVMGQYIDKYFKGKKGYLTEDRIRIYRLIENMAVGAGLPEAMHGAGAPTAMKLMITREANIEQKKELAKTIVGIKEDKYFQSIVGMGEQEYFQKLKGIAV
jgi:4-hydroxybutyryl-CoA dehydratase / vinylacetyl-CoA-Delta-isomerase